MDAERLDVFDDDGGRPLDSEAAVPELVGAALRDVRPLLAELLREQAQWRVAMSPALARTLEAALDAWDADARADGQESRRPTLATIDQMEDALSDALDSIDPDHADLRQRIRRTRDGLHEAGNLLAHEVEPSRDVLGQQRHVQDG